MHRIVFFRECVARFRDKCCKIAAAMRKSIFKGLKTLAACLFAAALVHSCQEEKPDIDVDGGNDKIFNFQTFSDSLIVNEENQVTVSFGLNAVPWDLDEELDVKIELLDTAGTDYKFAQLAEAVRNESGWTITVNLTKGFKSGDMVQLVISAPGKKYLSQLIVLFVPEPDLAMSINLKDEFRINEGGTTKLIIRTWPYNLPASDSVSIFFTDTLGAPYGVNMNKPVFHKEDSTWITNVGLKYGAKTGDAIRLNLLDKERDTTLFSAPLVVNIIPAEAPLYREIHRISGDVSAYEEGGMATIVFRTIPWDLLLESNGTDHVNVTDTAGVDTTVFTITSFEFQPDSSYTIQAKISATGVKKAMGVVRISSPAETIKSEYFTIEKVTFGIDRIRVLNYIYGPEDDISRMYYDGATKTFSCVLPATTNFKNQKIRISHNGDKLTVHDSLLEARTTKYNTLNFDTAVTITLWKYDLHKDYKVVFKNTGLPIVRINTPKDRDGNRKKITSRTTWMDLCQIIVEKPDGTIYYQDDSLSIRGRGNGTWTESDKKPYALKLNHKHKMLGMKKHKRWILLANYKDYTLLRNDAALWISRQTSLPYTINGRYVELVLNGVHQGNYYLCEQAKIDDDRINIDVPNLAEPSQGGFFMEIDTYLGYDGNTDPGFKSSYYDLPYIFKEPDEDENERTITSSHPAWKYLKDRVNEMEKCLNNRQRVLNHEYQDYIDIGSAIDYALIQEVTMNHDSYNTWPSNGPHSTYLYFDQTHTGGKFTFGPVWDFDYHTFMPKCEDNGVDLAKQWELLRISAKTTSGRYYYDSMLQDPAFKDSVVAHWDNLKDKFAGLPDYIDMMADSIRESERFNRILWFDKTNNTQNNDRGSFDYAVDRMKLGFRERWQWIEDHIRNL